MYQRNELTRNLLGNARPQSSQLAKPLWTDFGLKSAIDVFECRRGLIRQKKNQQYFRMRGKSYH